MGKQKSVILDDRSFVTVTEACAFYRITLGQFYYKKSKGLSIDEIFKGQKTKGTPQRKAVTEDYNFAALYPQILLEWFEAKNPYIDPNKVAPKSGKKVWWKCRNNEEHSWLSTFRDRAVGKGCPYCAGRLTTDKNSLCILMPEYAAEYANDLNHQTIESISISSGKTLWWRCVKGHEWKARTADRVNDKSGCPYCSGRRASPEYNLTIKFPALATQVDHNKHPNIDLKTITPHSSMKLGWICPKNSDHKWVCAVSMRTSQDTGCPFCSNKSVGRDNCLAETHPEIAKEWDYVLNEPLTPFEVVSGSNQRIWWKCNVAEDHIWKTSIHKRAIDGTQCPCCSGFKLSVTNRLDTQRPDIAAMLVKEKNPPNIASKVYATSSKVKLWFRCREVPSHIFYTSPNYLTVRGGRCTICAQSIMETQTSETLDNQGIEYIREYSIKELRGKRNPLRFDFYIPKYNAFIECDGEQHFKVTRYEEHKKEAQENLVERQRRDQIKNIYCKQHGLILLRIHYKNPDIPQTIIDFIKKLEQ